VPEHQPEDADRNRGEDEVPAELVLKRAANIPVVAWSGSDAVEGEIEVLRAGATAYFDKSDLGPLMRRLVELLNPQ